MLAHLVAFSSPIFPDNGASIFTGRKDVKPPFSLSVDRLRISMYFARRRIEMKAIPQPLSPGRKPYSKLRERAMALKVGQEYIVQPVDSRPTASFAQSVRTSVGRWGRFRVLGMTDGSVKIIRLRSRNAIDNS